MRSLAAIRSEYYAITEGLNAPRTHVLFATTPQHDGSPHVELTGDGYAYVITERGGELERRVTTKDDDILYWLVCDVTREMASQHELRHRNSREDSRRLLFRKHLDLLAAVSRRWQARKQAEYEAVLALHPFRDEMGEPSHALEPAAGPDSNEQSSPPNQ